MNPYEMKVFKINTDWIAAKDKNDAVRFYFKEYGEDADLSIIKEVDVLKDKMWYGFTLGQLIDYLEFKRRTLGNKSVQNLYRDVLEVNDEFRFKIAYGDYDYSLFITFADALYLDKKNEPYVLCSMEC